MTIDLIDQDDPNIKLYGVSTGNGNNGVSQMFPDYYVWTDQPYRLAKAGLIDTFNAGAGMEWAAKNVIVEGESEYTISAMILDPPSEDGEDEESDEDGSWSDANGAWLILEVFPVEESEMREGKPVYDSIQGALSETVLKMVTEEE